MLAGDWTGLLASQRMTDLHREADRQRLVRLAKAERRGGRRRLAWSIGWHGQVSVIQAARVWLQPRLRWRRAGLRQGGERA
jgi:hypothetical protein